MKIIKEVTIKSSPSQIYEAITNQDQLTQWFPDVVSLEPKIGGRICFRLSQSHSKEQTVEGKITEIEENKKISYTCGHNINSEFPWTQVTWKLERIDDQLTRVIITHTGFVDKSVMSAYGDGWSRFVEQLSAFTTPKKPVNISKQIVSAFIPGVQFLAFYRIKKLRKSITYLLLPAITIIAIFYGSGDMFKTYAENNFEQITYVTQYYIAGILMLGMFGSLLAGIAITNYLMHKWSKEWNRQFLET
jgi:uncharacterized protein YndB with AHSA1/START domain